MNLRNFGHGTGHGVGYFLNVHEGPQSIRPDLKNQEMLPGMVPLTNRDYTGKVYMESVTRT